MTSTEDYQLYIYVRGMRKRGPSDQINARYEGSNLKDETVAKRWLGHLIQSSKSEQTPTTAFNVSNTQVVGRTWEVEKEV